jgi:hypothetical protein
MAILAECPICHRKQATRNKLCSCGQDLDKAKRSRKVRYWIDYPMPDGKQKREYVGAFDDLDGYSIEDAQKAHSKRVVQKAENRLMDVKPKDNKTFNTLTKWYCKQDHIKAKASCREISARLKKFNSSFGDTLISQLDSTDLNNFQAKLKKEGCSDAYTDDVIRQARTMVNAASLTKEEKEDGRKADTQQNVRMAMTGHSTLEMDRRYDAVDMEDKLKAMEALKAFRKGDGPPAEDNMKILEAIKVIEEYIQKTKGTLPSSSDAQISDKTANLDQTIH